MRYSIILALLLTGCSTLLPVAPKWPEVPKEITEGCPKLDEVPATDPQLSTVVETVTKNYGTYYECQAKHEAWVEWYKAQRKIYEEVK